MQLWFAPNWASLPHCFFLGHTHTHITTAKVAKVAATVSVANLEHRSRVGKTIFSWQIFRWSFFSNTKATCKSVAFHWTLKNLRYTSRRPTWHPCSTRQKGVPSLAFTKVMPPLQPIHSNNNSCRLLGLRTQLTSYYIVMHLLSQTTVRNKIDCMNVGKTCIQCPKSELGSLRKLANNSEFWVFRPPIKV